LAVLLGNNCTSNNNTDRTTDFITAVNFADIAEWHYLTKPIPGRNGRTPKQLFSRQVRPGEVERA
jgi:hypothetical protein